MDEPLLQAAACLAAAAGRVRHGWTSRALARDADGAACHPHDPRAVAWCAEGAIIAAAPSGAVAELAAGAVCLTAGLGRDDLPWWSDWVAGDEEAVAQLFERAAECLGALSSPAGAPDPRPRP